MSDMPDEVLAAVRRLVLRAEQAEAERDRLRAALESIRDWPEDWQRDGWAIAQEFQGIAEEALDHD